MNYLLYQVYGSTDIINEAIFSLSTYFMLTTREERANTKVIVYTDSRKKFEQYFKSVIDEFIIQELNPEKIREYRGEIDFVHRVKVKCIEHFLENYQGDMIYFDSDTIFTKSPLNLFNYIDDENSLMHICEGEVHHQHNGPLKKLYRFLLRNEVPLYGNKTKIDLRTPMWNAGVIGINNSYIEHVKEVLYITDHVRKIYHKHIVEQFAFSLILGQDTQIHPSFKTVYHYWSFKEFRVHINRYLATHQTLDQFSLNDMPDPIKLTLIPKKKLKEKLKEILDWIPIMVQQLRVYYWMKQWKKKIQ